MAKFVGGLTINEFEENFGTVKSVQRGRATVTSSASVQITINAVDISKSIIIVSNFVSTNNYNYMQYSAQGAEGVLESSTSIHLYSSLFDSNCYNNVSWQVIEFY